MEQKTAPIVQNKESIQHYISCTINTDLLILWYSPAIFPEVIKEPIKTVGITSL